jgi:hypothetical protein
VGRALLQRACPEAPVRSTIRAMRTPWFLGAVLFSVATVGCAKQEPPAAASSAGQLSYATEYPETVSRESERYETDAKAAEDHVGKFAGYVDALKDPDWTVVGTVYQRADEEGRSQAYANSRRQESIVKDFYADERKELVGRVAGATQHAAKEKGTEVQLYGPVDWSLEKGIEESLDDRRHAASDAHRLLESEEKKLGRVNQKPLEGQIDEILLASYVAHVGAAQEEHELRRLVDESANAQKTLERRREELKEQPKPSAKEVAEVDAALAALTPAVDKARAQLEAAEKRRLDLQKKYDTAMDALKKQVAEKADAQASAKEPAK